MYTISTALSLNSMVLNDSLVPPRGNYFFFQAHMHSVFPPFIAIRFELSKNLFIAYYKVTIFPSDRHYYTSELFCVLTTSTSLTNAFQKYVTFV